MIRPEHYAKIVFSFILILSVFQNADAQKPPVAPVREVVDEYHGTKINDPYRFLENVKDPEVQTWMKGQAEYAESVLKRIRGRDAMLKRIQEIDDDVASVISRIRRIPNGKIFYLKRLSNENISKLYEREGRDGKEILLVDPEALEKSTGTPHAINYYEPSPDGRYVGYGISKAGSENSVLHILEVVTGKIIDQPIDRAKFGTPRWLPDGKGFFYNRIQLLPPNSPPTELYKKTMVYFHKLGTDPEQDELVFGYGMSGIDIKPTDFPGIIVQPGSDQVIGVINKGVSPEYAFYIAPLSKIDGSQTAWRKIFDMDDKVRNIFIRGNDLYMLTFKNAPRSKLLKTSLAKPDLEKAETVVPMTEATIEQITMAKDGFYVELMDGVVGRLLRIPFDEKGKQDQIQLPFDGDVFLLGNHTQISGVLFGITSWIRTDVIYEYDPVKRNVVDTKLQPLGKYDAPEDLVSVEVKVKSHDGTLVPLSIIHKRNLKLDGKNPTLLYGYGAYGIPYNPYFSPSDLAWLEKDGILANAHVRGGGEYGEEWHLAGYQKTKPNTWKDFIACAEYLIEKKYTSSQFLAGSGGSAGGILIGRALTSRPDLFTAVIPQVGCLDMLRMEVTPNGVPNIPEFGSVKTEEGFKALYEMSSYHHVKDGVRYPAVLLTHGVNDTRVEVWTSAKMAARLQAATSSGKPVLLRLDYDAGHGVGSTKKQYQEEQADIYSFILWQCRVKEFQTGN
jgi:prolyl oligopeptidase